MAISKIDYDKIARIYEDRRFKHELELRAHKDEILEKVEGYAALEQEGISLAMDKARALIGSGQSHEEEIKALQEKLFDLSMRKKDLLAAHGYSRDYLELTYDCPSCRDTGYNGDEKCNCFQQLEVSFLYEASHVKEFLEQNNFSKLTMEYFTDEATEEAFRKAVHIAKDFIKNFHNGCQNLFLYGTVGTGKSFLSGCIAKELMDLEVPVVYLSSVKLFQMLNAYSYDVDKTNLYLFTDTLYDSKLLIIDDLGTEFLNDFVRSNLFEIINERQIRGNSTIISTNLQLEGFRTNYGDRCLSRITGNYTLCHLVGRDIRQTMALQRHRESLEE